MRRIDRLSGGYGTEAFVCENEEEENAVSKKYGWGHDSWEFTRSEIETLFSGKIIVICDGEYTHAIKFKEE